ncbi:MAG TPA: SPOR domain-containing protein [Pyrinomonadaceae bacterium]|nr:SPOR domain-containing protein [Pyrinomonadaceae bacterium]
MKHCPRCGSSYTDDTLVYCLQDGATLQQSSGQSNPLSMVATLSDDAQTADSASARPDLSSAPTVEIPSSALPTSLYQEARATTGPSGAAGRAPSASVAEAGATTRVILTTAIVTTLLLAAGGFGAWLFFRGAGDGRGREAARNSALTSNSPSAANESGAAQSNSQTVNADRPDKGGRWFVVLGAFQQRSGANERMEDVRREGFDARVVYSNDYPNFTSDLWLVVMGPYTRNRAEEVLEQVRPKIKDAYTKSGW